MQLYKKTTLTTYRLKNKQTLLHYRLQQSRNWDFQVLFPYYITLLFFCVHFLCIFIFLHLLFWNEEKERESCKNKCIFPGGKTRAFSFKLGWMQHRCELVPRINIPSTRQHKRKKRSQNKSTLYALLITPTKVIKSNLPLSSVKISIFCSRIASSWVA